MTASPTAKTCRAAQAPELVVTYERRRALFDELLALRAERATRLDAHTRASREADLDIDRPAPDVLLAERRVAQLEDILARCVVVERESLDGAIAALGGRVRVRWDDGAEECYVIVTPAELGRRTGQVSCDSPLGRALLGRRAGERVTADAPAGRLELTLVRVDEGAVD
jgi:transcription elongation factor GreA